MTNKSGFEKLIFAGEMAIQGRTGANSGEGKDYYNARWYDPNTGRFTTSDPIKDGLNWYAYCANNPVNNVDPSGLRWQRYGDGSYRALSENDTIYQMYERLGYETWQEMAETHGISDWYNDDASWANTTGADITNIQFHEKEEAPSEEAGNSDSGDSGSTGSSSSGSSSGSGERQAEVNEDGVVTGWANFGTFDGGNGPDGSAQAEAAEARRAEKAKQEQAKRQTSQAAEERSGSLGGGYDPANWEKELTHNVEKRILNLDPDLDDESRSDAIDNIFIEEAERVQSKYGATYGVLRDSFSRYLPWHWGLKEKLDPLYIDIEKQIQIKSKTKVNKIMQAFLAGLVGGYHVGLMQGFMGSLNDAGRSSNLNFATRQLQKKFKHAGDFGIKGNYNSANSNAFKSALQGHIDNPATQAIQGSYRGQNVTHYLNAGTGQNVIIDSSGNFLSGWKLGTEQLNGVLNAGKLW